MEIVMKGKSKKTKGRGCVGIYQAMEGIGRLPTSIG
jgi:hypothetical protein